MFEFLTRKVSKTVVGSPERLSASRILLEEQIKKAPEVILAILLEKSNVESIADITPKKTLADIGINGKYADVEMLLEIEEGLNIKNEWLSNEIIAEEDAFTEEAPITVGQITDSVLNQLNIRLKVIIDKQAELLTEVA